MIKVKVFSVAACLFLSGFLCVYAADKNQAAESVYYNGTVITMTEDSSGKPVTAQAVLVKDGKIAEVGTTKTILKKASKNANKFDLKGQTLLPGFIDAHSHISSYAQTLAIAQLGQATDISDIIKAMKEFKDETKPSPGEWIVGFGYDHNSLAEKRHPTRDDLDKVSTDYPVLITHTSGHMGVMNSKALALCGISASTPDPQGGKIGRRPGSNEPNGYMEETAFIQNAGKANPPKADIAELFRRAQARYFEYGVTTTQDALMGKKEFDIMMPIIDANVLSIDVVGYVNMRDTPEYAQQYASLHNVYKNHFKIGGYKIFLDGSPQGRTAWLTKPYIPVPGASANTSDGDPNYKGYPVYKDEQVVAFVRKSIADGMSLHAHCNGDAAADQFINAFKTVMKEDGVKDTLRPTMIHSQVIRPEQFSEMEKIGIIPSMFPAHVWYWGDVHLANLGKERGMIVSAVNSARKAGTKYTFHQDTPVINPDMMETIWCAVNRITKSGVQLSVDEKVSPYDALKAVTTNASYEIWEENSKGTIESGKRADFVILEKNPLTVEPMKLRGIRVMETIKDGTVVYKR